MIRGFSTIHKTMIPLKCLTPSAWGVPTNDIVGQSVPAS